MAGSAMMLAEPLLAGAAGSTAGWRTTGRAGFFWLGIAAVHAGALVLLARPHVLAAPPPEPIPLQVTMWTPAEPAAPAAAPKIPPRPLPARARPTPEPPPKAIRPRPASPAAPPTPATQPVSTSAPVLATAQSTESGEPVNTATPRAPAPETSGAAESPLLDEPDFSADYLDNPAPEYPSASRRLGENGRVVLRVFVEPDGRAGQVEIRRGSGFARLDEAARAAVLRWRFVPARRLIDGQPRPVGAWVAVPITFKTS